MRWCAVQTRKSARADQPALPVALALQQHHAASHLCPCQLPPPYAAPPHPQVVIEAGPLRLPLPVKTDTRGFVEWDYLDGDFRISRGSKGSTFIHVREA